MLGKRTSRGSASLVTAVTACGPSCCYSARGMATSSTKLTGKKNPSLRSTDKSQAVADDAMRPPARNRLQENDLSAMVTQFVLHCAEYRSNAEFLKERNAALMRQHEQLRRAERNSSPID